MDADQEPPQAFVTALVTEHFVLQGIRSTLTSESASRAALYLAALTGSLIALGFVARDATVLGPFATAVIPALLILGEFTYWRLVQGGVEDLHHAWEMRRIRAYYRHLVPPGLGFFADTCRADPSAPQRTLHGNRGPGFQCALDGIEHGRSYQQHAGRRGGSAGRARGGKPVTWQRDCFGRGGRPGPVPGPREIGDSSVQRRACRSPKPGERYLRPIAKRLSD